MNEGENSGIPSGSIFSSPNIEGSQTQPNQAPAPMPEQPVDITKSENPTLTTTVASMAEMDGPAKPIVTSGGDPVDKKKPRFGLSLGTRHFKEKSQTPAAPVMQAAQSPTFANAPEFFNDAVGDIVLADAAEAEKKNKTKKFIIIGGIAAVAVVVLLVVVGIMTMGGGSSAPSDFKKTFYSFANMYIKGTDSEDRLEGEYNKDDISYAWKTTKEEYADKLKAKYDAFYSLYSKNKSKLKIDSIMTEFDMYFAVVNTRLRHQAISEKDAGKYVTTMPLAQAQTTIEKQFNTDNMSPLATSVLENYKEESVSLLTIYAIYNNYGCVDKKAYVIDGKCTSKVSVSDNKTISDLRTEILKTRSNSNNIFSDAEAYISKNIYTIANSIEGKK